MMSRTVSAIFIISCLLYLLGPLYAQDALIAPYEHRALLFKEDDLSQINLSEPMINLAKPIQIKIELYKTSLDYQLFSATRNRLAYLRVEDDGLFGNDFQRLELDLAKTTPPEIKKLHNTAVNRKVFNMLYNKAKVDEKRMLREAWKRTFGIDVWYPYYKAKEIEDWVKERFSVKIFGLKGKPKFERDHILYIFKKKL